MRATRAIYPREAPYSLFVYSVVPRVKAEGKPLCSLCEIFCCQPRRPIASRRVAGCQNRPRLYHAPHNRTPGKQHAMITKFDSLYAGHIDMDNVGYGGTPINDRRYSNEKLA